MRRIRIFRLTRGWSGSASGSVWAGRRFCRLGGRVSREPKAPSTPFGVPSRPRPTHACQAWLALPRPGVGMPCHHSGERGGRAALGGRSAGGSIPMVTGRSCRPVCVRVSCLDECRGVVGVAEYRPQPFPEPQPSFWWFHRASGRVSHAAKGTLPCGGPRAPSSAYPSGGADFWLVLGSPFLLFGVRGHQKRVRDGYSMIRSRVSGSC